MTRGPSTFDPKGLKAQLEGDLGYRFDLASSFPEAEKVGGLASSAHAFMNTGIACVLVGLDTPARQVLRKALEWLETAIRQGERPQRYFPGATEALRLSDHAVLTWLLGSGSSGASFMNAIQFMDRYLDGMGIYDPEEVSLSLLAYLEAGLPQRALEIFERSASRPPTNTLRVTNEAQMVYVLSAHHLKTDDVRRSLGNFLDRETGKWLSRGHFDRAARWMKVAYGKEGARASTPCEVVLACYRHVPCATVPGPTL